MNTTTKNTNPAGNPRIGEISGGIVVPVETPERSEEFESFEALARKLVGVPKQELDEKLDDARRKKPQLIRSSRR